ncbi:MAG: sigma-54 dependent transcriptional regulator [Acidobacteriia bacterium]|nr:sigma-54 dependent transcriptional regulator [Terriglobia bacterium]
MDGQVSAFPSPQNALNPVGELLAHAGFPCEAIQVHTFLGMPAVISSPPMRRLIEFVERVARANAAILITGESGTGKELIARALHHYSMRCTRPWIDLNCAALPELLIESELFGYEKGAFSGALSTKPGMFELAQTGSVFLDEIGDLPPRMQVKLLRVLDGAPYYRLGGTKKISVDARVIAATNQDLERAMAAGNFRRDLYYRLAQVRIHVPPLRERPDDVRPLARFFLEKQEPRWQLSERAMQALEQYVWPGNVRELRNVVVQAAVVAEGDVIESEDLPFVVQSAPPRPVTLEDLEREMILKVMTDTGGQQQQTADILGISLRTLSRKLKQYQEDGRCAQGQ